LGTHPHQKLKKEQHLKPYQIYRKKSRIYFNKKTA